MRNVMKATTLESRFPLLAVEHGCIISKDADITAAFEVERRNTRASTPRGARQSRCCPTTRCCTSRTGM